MNPDTRNLILAIGMAAALTAGVIVENVWIAMRPEDAGAVASDIEKVRDGLDRAGLKPREALYWKEL